MVFPDVPIRRINNVNKSCKVIEGNPAYCLRVKVPTVSGHQRYQNLLEKSALVSYCQVGNQYKWRVSLSIYHIVTHTQLQRMSEREEAGIRERERVLLSGDHLTVLGFTFGADSISEEVVGFSPLWFPRGKSLCPLSLFIDCCACYSPS